MRTEHTNQIEAAAAEWLIRRDSEYWTEQDQARLDVWLDASALNRVAYLRLEQTWDDAGRLKALAAGIAGDRPPPPGEWNLTPFFEPQAHNEPLVSESTFFAEFHASEPVRKLGSAHTPRLRGLVALAGCLILAVTGGYYLYTLGILSGSRYATPVGGIESVATADGSVVTLNTDSQIRVALTKTERQIDLRHGEAYFEVAHDPTRPFVVHAANERIIAVGTKFSVRREDGDVQVVVIQGKVRLESDEAAKAGGTSQPQAVAAKSIEEPVAVFLTPDMIARASDTGVLVQRVSPLEVQEHLSWRTGILMFRNETLAVAVTEFNRYNVRQIVIGDPILRDLKIEGNFRATNVDAFARLLEAGFPLRVTDDGDRIILTAR